jgi:two-component system cell cycle response regulator DivK
VNHGIPMMPLHARASTAWPLALLADGNDDSRLMYAEYLRLSAYRVEECDDGRNALAKAIMLRPSVVVADTRLPGINGYQLCQLLRADVATRTVPIVVVTADVFPLDVERAELAGADSVLLKPCLPEALDAEIRRLTALSSELRARSRETRRRIPAQIARAEDVVARSRQRRIRKNVHERRDTTEPPAAPPLLLCPSCDHPLLYLRSHIGGVTAANAEQWDYYQCGGGCGTYQYRQRTRKMRRV